MDSYAWLYGTFTGAQAELLELNAEAVDGAIQAVLAALASGLTWAEVRFCYAALVGLGPIARLGAQQWHSAHHGSALPKPFLDKRPHGHAEPISAKILMHLHSDCYTRRSLFEL